MCMLFQLGQFNVHTDRSCMQAVLDSFLLLVVADNSHPADRTDLHRNYSLLQCEHPGQQQGVEVDIEIPGEVHSTAVDNILDIERTGMDTGILGIVLHTVLPWHPCQEHHMPSW